MPGECRTFWTMGGASAEDWLGAAAWPFLRCNKPPCSGANDTAGIFMKLD